MKNSRVPLDATGDKMGFPLEKGERRNKKKSSFLQDFAELLKTGILGFDSHSNRILFLLHHLVKKQKMWDTHFFFSPRLLKKPSSRCWCGWKWNFVVPNVSLSRRLLQVALLWLVSRCDSGPGHPPPPVLPVPVLCCTSSGACPCPLLPLPARGSGTPGLQLHLTLQAAPGEGFPHPVHNQLDASGFPSETETVTAAPYGSGSCKVDSAGRCGS